MAVVKKTSARAPKKTDAEQVTEFMEQLQHPLKAEIEAVRHIINQEQFGLTERIKWNAPSYRYQGTDLLTFNPRMLNRVHLIFHHIAIVHVKSTLLEGDYKDRRMLYFTDMADVETKRKELEAILSNYLQILKDAN